MISSRWWNKKQNNLVPDSSALWVQDSSSDAKKKTKRMEIDKKRRVAKSLSWPSIENIFFRWWKHRMETSKMGHDMELTRARLRSSSWAALTFSFLPPQALNTEACKARPYENVKAHGRRGWLLMAFKLTDASSSDWPPDKKVTPGMRLRNV